MIDNKFPDLCFPTFEYRLKIKDAKTYLFDEIRKKWLVYTPEEWVRINLIRFLISYHGYPYSLIAIEKSLKLANKTLRFDALVYNRNVEPLMIIECKAPNVNLSQKVFDQIWSYNYKINAPFFLVTNGVHFVMGSCLPNKTPDFFKKVLDYNELLKLIDSSSL